LVSSIRTVGGAEILLPPSPGVGDLHETITIVKLSGPGTPATLVKAVEDAQTVHRDEILPGVRTLITGTLSPSATPDGIMEALRAADLLEEN
jgi:hypothetical protein